MKGFKAFLLRGNIVDLAVAVVVGVAFNAVVHSLVSGLVTPLISALAGQPKFHHLVFTVGNSTFNYGTFLNALISFLILATVVYFLIVVPMNKVLAFSMRKQVATQRECPECLQQIPALATRCMYCTASVPLVSDAAEVEVPAK
jgi:large conductance mechanosensitive channel